MVSIKLLMLPALFFLVSCSSENEDNWVIPYFSQHRIEFLQIKNFIDSCDGFSYANGVGIYMDRDAGSCKNGIRPSAITPKLRKMNVYWVTNDTLRHGGVGFVTKSPGLFGTYGAIHYNVIPKATAEIKAEGGTPLERVCPCHWFYIPS
jgi:hypothetical protein